METVKRKLRSLNRTDLDHELSFLYLERSCHDFQIGFLRQHFEDILILCLESWKSHSDKLVERLFEFLEIALHGFESMASTQATRAVRTQILSDKLFTAADMFREKHSRYFPGHFDNED